MNAPTHVPVMRDRVVALLAPALREPGSVFVDATLGLGGHSAAVLSEVPTCRLVGLDRDTAALEIARERLAPWSDRITLVHAVYDRMPEVLQSLGIAEVQGILFDLGVSSMQLDEADRGFAYAQDAPLDMRMDRTTGSTAADVLNTYSVEDLTRILRAYGEERYARRIAERIVAERQIAPWDTSARLVEVVRASIPAAVRATGGHPAKRTFQALRIEVNQELEILPVALRAAIDVLAPGARLAVLSYHSGEDRIVKSVMREAENGGCTCRPGLPCGCGAVPVVRRVRVRREATPAETSANPRAASARLRVVEKLATGER